MDKGILKKAIELWGRETQINKIQEEALELALVISRLKCPTKDHVELENELYSEIADNIIMLEQAKILFDEKRINDMIEFKLSRLVKKYFSEL